MDKTLEYLAEAAFGTQPLEELRRHLSRDYAHIESNVERKKLIEERLEQDIHSTLAKVLPEYKKYLELTPENAKERLLAMGWAFSDRLDFTNFQLGYWMIESKPTGFGHREGRLAFMNFHTKEITTGGFDTTG